MIRIGLLLFLLAAPAAAQQDTLAPQLPPGAPVVFQEDTLFLIRARLGPFAPEDRARAVTQRLVRVSDDPSVADDTVRIEPGDGTTDIMIGDIVLVSVTDADAAVEGLTLAELADARAEAIRQALEGASLWAILKSVLFGLLLTLLATLILLVLWRGINWLFPKLESRLGSTHVPAIRIQRLELLSAERVTRSLVGALRIARVVVIVVLLFYYVPLVFSFFPWTEGVADRILDYIVDPLRQVWDAFVGYIPNAFYIAVIVVVTRYTLKFIHLFFDGITKGTLQFRGFYQEWGEPTYKIVRFLVLAFAFIVVFPYLPGAGSEAFRGVSVFLGVLVSFGSASAIANVIAGVVITYMRPFKLGDRVKIADTVGDVVERNLLVTRVNTTKNVRVTIPNAMVLSSHIINYSASAKDSGLILHTTVTIGYDVPWKQVHELLLAAAAATENVLDSPKPFVLQTSLDDFYVSYELNVFTETPQAMPRIYSDLHQHIQDRFNEAGVEIMSPHYGALRDGNDTTVPPDQRPPDYKPTGFRIFPFGWGRPDNPR